MLRVWEGRALWARRAALATASRHRCIELLGLSTFPACLRTFSLLCFLCGSKGLRKRFRPSDK